MVGLFHSRKSDVFYLTVHFCLLPWCWKISGMSVRSWSCLKQDQDETTHHISRSKVICLKIWWIRILPADLSGPLEWLEKMVSVSTFCFCDWLFTGLGNRLLDWKEYIVREGATVAPVTCFKHVSMNYISSLSSFMSVLRRQLISADNQWCSY